MINIAEHFLTFGDIQSNKINSKHTDFSQRLLCPPFWDCSNSCGLGVTWRPTWICKLADFELKQDNPSYGLEKRNCEYRINIDNWECLRRQIV